MAHVFGLSITIVVPVFDGADNIARLVPRLAPLIANGEEKDGVEVLFVNDGSVDESWSRITSLAAEHVWISGLDLDGHFGQHAALVRGALAARSRVVVTLDDDLEHPPASIPNLAAAIERGADLVYGTPVRRGAIGARRAGSFLARTGLALRFRSRSAFRSSPFRAFRRELLVERAERAPVEPNIDALLYAARPRVAHVPVEFGARALARSRYTLRSLVRATTAVVHSGSPSDFRARVPVRDVTGEAAGRGSVTLHRDDHGGA